MNMSSEIRLETAYSYLHRGQIDQAIELIKELLSEDPNIAIYHGLLAECLLDKKRIYAAEYELSRALELEPQLPYLFLLKARLSFIQRNFKDAIAFCDESLSIDPEDVDAYLLKSDIHLISEDYKNAKLCIDQAAKIDPDTIQIDLAYGDYFFEQGDHLKAAQFAIDALSKDAQNVEANVLMGHLKLAKGEVDDAEYHAKFAIYQSPESELALRLFCNIKMRKSWFLGLWWWFNSKVASLSNIKASFVLICGYLLFNLLAQIFFDLGHTGISTLTSYAWLALVIYSWVGIPAYYRKLQNELDKFQFRNDF